MDLEKVLFKNADSIYNDNLKLLGIIIVIIALMFIVIVYTIVNIFI